MRLIFRLSLAFAMLCCFLTTAQYTSAQSAPVAGVTQITGVVLDAQRHPVGDAQVHVFGPAEKGTVTSGDGSFAFLNLPAGTYRLDISKGGFDPSTQDDIVTTAGSTTNLGFTLQAASLTSLTVIGNVSVNARNSANSINTTPASIVDVPASTFTDQGQLSVVQVLNEEPGITVGVEFDNNGSNALAADIPSIRGGLPYETESLIDGHAISLGQLGFFSPAFLSPYLLQNVEVVKGPGATSPSINYAINGTVNYRTLEPTLKPEESVDLGEDQYGGNFANFRATGTLPGGRLSYAFDYVTQGTQGAVRGFTRPGILLPFGPVSLNGSSINAFGGYTFGSPPANQPGIYEDFDNVSSFLLCCPSIPMNANQRNELGKIRYAFTPSTTLTVTWLGGQTAGPWDGRTLLTPCYNTIFAPPAGYSGSLPTGYQTTPTFITGFGEGVNLNQDTNLFETEFHTPIGKTATLLLRQYSSSIQTFCGGPGDSGPTSAPVTSITTAVYGGVYYGNSTTPTIFNGQLGTLTIDQYLEVRSYNDLNGYTAEIDKQAGDDLLSLSYDEEKTSTYATSDFFAGVNSVSVPGGSSQTFQSVMGRVQFELGSRVNGALSDNFGSYTDVYTQNDGVTFQSATHTYEAPRLSLTWRPNSNQSVRASVGTSIAPPYIALLNNNELVGASGSFPLYFTETANSGDVLPETAIGFDIGLDTRLHSPFTVLSVDAYQTLLHNQFLESTTQQGTYSCTDPTSYAYGQTGPLYITKTANLGHSEYEGVELSLHRNPPTGWGYRVQGSLMRAFAYDLPAGFYDTPAGPDTTNLGILPNVNFQASGEGFNGMSSAPVPYSMGYGEINYRGRNGAYFLGGITYYGPNNAYLQPAFEVVTVSFTQPLTHRASLQLSIYNLANAYSNVYMQYDGSPIHVPLENGEVGLNISNVVGPSTARLTLHIDM